MHAFAKLTHAEFRLFLREPVVVFFSLAFPAILVGILGSIPDFRKPSPEIGGLRYVDVYVPIALLLVLAMMALQFAPAVLANYREKGILRRMSATPVSPSTLLGAQLASSLVTTLLSVAVVSLLGWLAFAVPAPRQFVGFVVAFVLIAAALFAIGLFVASVAPNGKAGNAVGTILFFPVMFFSGLWLPREVMPAWLRRIGEFTPLGAGEHALHDAATGAWPHAAQLLVLVAYAAAFGLAAARLFRWE